MQVRGSAPHSGGKDRNWKSIGLKLNQKTYGWIAGEAISLTVHQGKPSKVCIRAYQGKKTPCEKCEQGKPITNLIFVPFYPEANTLRCVLHVHDDCLKALAALDLHDYFCAWRGSEPDVGVQLTKVDSGPKYTTPIATRRSRADISDWLCGFMGVRGVLSPHDLYHGAQFVADVGCAPAAIPEVASESQSTASDQVRITVAGLADQFNLRGGLTADGSAFSEKTPDGRCVVREPHRNGKGKH